MKRKVIRLTVTDGSGSWRRSHDSVLSAVDPGKIFTNGTVWHGDLKPKLDAMLDRIEPLVTGFTVGQTLHAQEMTASDALTGRTWTGDLQARLTRAATTTGDTDMTGVLQELDALHRALGTKNPADIADSVGRVRRAADAVRSKGRTADGNWATQFLSRSRGTASSAIAQIQRTGKNTTDAASGAVRDALGSGGTAKTMDGKIRAINEANRAFWAAQGT